jgi:16S rRNA (guanine1207-N2)-methyltransferase
VVCARRTRDGERHKDRTHPITVARGTRELTILTRPGVFVYGRLDGGARAVLETLSVESGECVLDLGSGTGVLGLAAALDAGPEGTVLVDSNARAVDLARASAELNGLGAVTVCLRGDLERIPGGPFDLVLANPPYYGDGRIASAFAAAAAEHASPQGRCLFVTKAAGMHDEILRGCFTRVASRSVGDYVVFEASRGRA